MKAILEIKFLKDRGKKIGEEHTKNKRFIKLTEKTLKGLCDLVDKWFGHFALTTKTTFQKIS